MGVIGTIQQYLFVGVAVVGLALEVWALVDAARTPTRSFQVADKRTKKFWLILLVVAALIGFLALPAPLGFAPLPVMFGLLAVVPAGIYLADVRPAVQRYSGRGGGSRW